MIQGLLASPEMNTIPATTYVKDSIFKYGMQLTCKMSDYVCCKDEIVRS
jgi:hypothetical protein